MCLHDTVQKRKLYIVHCTLQYIGKSEIKVSERLSEHRGYVKNKIYSQPTGEHFNLPGHSLSDMILTVIEKVKVPEKSYIEEREHYFIRLFNTFYNGINKMP